MECEICGRKTPINWGGAKHILCEEHFENIENLHTTLEKGIENKSSLIADSIGIAFIVSTIFYFLFPAVVLILVFASIPVLTDIAGILTKFPASLLNLPLPDSDVLGYELTIARRFWTPIIFVITTLIIWRRNKQKME